MQPNTGKKRRRVIRVQAKHLNDPLIAKKRILFKSRTNMPKPPKFYSIARKRTAFIETPPAIVADIMKLFTGIDTDSDGRIASHDMGKHLYAINRLYKLLHGIPAAARGFSDTTEIITHFDEDDDGELSFQEFLKGMSEIGAFEKITAKTIGRKAGTSKSFDRAIQGVKDTLLDAAGRCKPTEVEVALGGLCRMYDRSTSYHRHARRFRDLQDAARNIPRGALPYAAAKVVLDMLHRQIREDAAIIITRSIRSYKHLLETGNSSHMWAAAIRNVQNIERRRQRGETQQRLQKRRVMKILKDKAATYIQSLFRGLQARKQYAGVIAERVEAKTKAKLELERAAQAREKQIELAKRAKKRAARMKELENIRARRTSTNPFQRNYLYTFSNQARPRLGKFLPGQINDATCKETKTDDIKSTILGNSMLPYPSSQPNSTRLRPTTAPMPNNKASMSLYQSSPGNTASLWHGSTHASFMSSGSMFASTEIAPEQSQSTAAYPAVNKNAIQQLIDANIMSKDEVPLGKKKVGKQSVVRATVGTSLDPWRDGKSYMARTNKFDRQRGKEHLQHCSSVYGRKVKRPARRKSRLGKGAQGMSPSPRKTRDSKLAAATMMANIYTNTNKGEVEKMMTPVEIARRFLKTR